MKRLLPILIAMLLVACSSEDYETGHGRWSFMRADFADVYTDGEASMVSAMTDDGDSLLFAKGVRPAWVQTPDSCYRALLYYNKVEGRADVQSVASVLVPKVRLRQDDKDPFVDDPVKVVGAWMSANGRYINLDLELMTGRDDGQAVTQKVGVECDTIVTDEAGRRHVRLSLYHDQNNSPQYYSSEVYVSIPVGRMPVVLRKQDEVDITINTYDGTWTRTFVI